MGQNSQNSLVSRQCCSFDIVTREAEVERAKSKLKASILMHLDGTTSIADDIGRQVLSIWHYFIDFDKILAHGRRLSAAEIFLRINAITTKDVMRVASEHCEDVDPVIAAVGPSALLPGTVSRSLV
jgi:processing peptidase subunit beta